MEKLYCHFRFVKGNLFQKSGVSCVLGICFNFLLRQYFSIHPNWIFLRLLNNTKRSLFWWLTLLPCSLERLSRQEQPATERTAEKTDVQIPSFFHWSLCWGEQEERPAWAVPKMTLRNLPVQYNPIDLPYKPFQHYFRDFPLSESSQTAPQFFFSCGCKSIKPAQFFPFFITVSFLCLKVSCWIRLFIHF